MDTEPLDTIFIWAVIVDPAQDHVAVAKREIEAGTRLRWPDHGNITVKADVLPGHRFAIREVPAGDWIRQYGQPFARSRGLEPGDPVNAATVDDVPPPVDVANLVPEPPELPSWEGLLPTFQGFRREDGRVGVRNWVLVVPTSMCASHEATRIVRETELRKLYTRAEYPNVDGVVAIPHPGGCGCPDIDSGTLRPGTLETTLTILSRYIQHPNVGAVIMVELGCEKTNLAAFGQYFLSKDLEAVFKKPVLTLSIQEIGGTQRTIQRGLQLMPAVLTTVNKSLREPAPLSELALGLECGGSDAFSGLSANPALGEASDLLVRAGGSSVIAEVPEFSGAQHLFARRAVDQATADQILATIDRYAAYAARGGHTMEENPSPGNKAGGLLNITIKALGAMAKAGAAPVQGVLDYGDWLWDRRQPGLYMLDTPGYDQISVPGLVASGCQLVCFTTGRGTGIGNAIAPVIKIGSTDALYRSMGLDIDINAGVVLSQDQPLETVGRAIFNEIVSVASGKWTKAEYSGHQEFAIWDREGIAL